MTKSAFERVKDMLAHIEYLQQCEQMLYMIDHVARGRRDDAEYTSAYGTMHHALYAKELEAWRSVFMLTLAATPEQQKEVRARAYKRFLSDRASVAYLMTEDLETPAGWPGNDEDDLRAWLKDNFAEKGSATEP